MQTSRQRSCQTCSSISISISFSTFWTFVSCGYILRHFAHAWAYTHAQVASHLAAEWKQKINKNYNKTQHLGDSKKRKHFSILATAAKSRPLERASHDVAASPSTVSQHAQSQRRLPNVTRVRAFCFTRRPKCI